MSTLQVLASPGPGLPAELIRSGSHSAMRGVDLWKSAGVVESGIAPIDFYTTDGQLVKRGSWFVVRDRKPRRKVAKAAEPTADESYALALARARVEGAPPAGSGAELDAAREHATASIGELSEQDKLRAAAMVAGL